MEENSTFITEDGLEKLKVELDNLKNVKRKEIAERIQEAKDLGDLSENAEYSDAKEEQTFIESRILEIEGILRSSTVIAKSKQKGVIHVGSTFTAKHSGSKAATFTLVGTSEAEPASGKISHESPLGKAFMGKKAGESVDVIVPAGTITYTVESIT